MKKFEVSGKSEQSMPPQEVADELADQPQLLQLLKQLPEPLWARHFKAIEAIEHDYASEDQDSIQSRKAAYLTDILQQREEAIESYVAGDQQLREIFESLQKGELRSILGGLLASPEDSLGSGQTARVKSLELPSYPDRIAVKYLLTPTTKTLSVEGEYDMSREVEMITHIEGIEAQLGAGEHIRVPHPLFYYKRGKLQCYGMSQVDGVALDALTGDSPGAQSPMSDDVLRRLRERYATQESRDRLFSELEVFMRAVHEECLHGDIKLRNIMVDQEGIFYLIDFGQAVTMDTMTEASREQFENLKEAELAQVRECVVRVFNALRTTA